MDFLVPAGGSRYRVHEPCPYCSTTNLITDISVVIENKDIVCTGCGKSFTLDINPTKGG